MKSERFLLGVLLAIATLVVYFPVHHHPFVNYDDIVYVVDNPHIKSGLDWETISWAFTTFYQFNWHPLTWLSHAMDVQLYQLDPGGHHVTNLVFAIANVLLLYWVLMRATGYIGRSVLVAGLFALHPINVESVAWIAERKNLLSMLFFLLALAAHRWYVTGSSRQPNIGRYVLVIVLFAMGLMSKPQIITFPFLLLLWDYWPLRRMATRTPDLASETATEALLPQRTFGYLVLEKLPLFALCAIDSVVTVLAQRAGGAVVSLEQYPFSIRLTNAIVAYVRYIGKLFWPAGLAPMYPHPWHVLPLWQVAVSLVILALITVLAVVKSSRRYLLVGWLWFLGALVPMIGLVHVGNQAMADRYAYLPFIGLFLMIVWAAAEATERLHLPAAAMWSASVAVLFVLAVLTHFQLSYWNDNATLWEHTLQVTTDNYIAHDNLAQLLMEQGLAEEAMKHYRAALAIYASDPTSNLQIAIYDHQHGRLQEAIARYNQMISITPDGAAKSELFSNRGLVYLDQHDAADAQQSLQTAVAMDPHNYRGWLGLGVLAMRAGDLNLAIQNYQRSTAAKPTSIAYSLLAQVLQQSGRVAEAQAARDQARLLASTTSASPSFSEGGLLAH